MSEAKPSEGGSLKGRIEAILFVAGEAVGIRDLAKALRVEEKELKETLKKIGSEYDYEQRGFMLKRFGEKVQLATRPLYSEDVLRLLQPVQQHKDDILSPGVDVALSDNDNDLSDNHLIKDMR